MLELPNEEGVEFDKLREFSQPIFENITLDMHKAQFANIGTVKKQISAWQLVFKSMRHHRMIKWVTMQILKIGILKQRDFNLTDGERQTLFKNSMKLIMGWTHKDGNVKNSWKQMAYLCKLFKVNIFEMRDKLGKGIAYRLVKAWPTQFEKVEYM